MQNRHPLETALSQAIKENKEKQALKLIDIFLLENTEANLASLDWNKESFLFQALEAGLEELAVHLLAIQKDNQSIIFGKNINQKTLFQIVAKQGYVDILNNLIRICYSHSSFTNFWLEKDNEGDTTLHIAARADKIETIKLLLNYLRNNNNSKNIINQTNLAGKTALHEAFYFYSNETIKLLIENDADVNVKDNDSISPFDLICKRESETQLQLMRSLSQAKQNTILQSYRQEIIRNQNKKEIKKTYFTLLGLHSLQALVLGLHEFDENIPIRNSFFNIKDNLEMNVSLEILNRMPIYYEKLKKIAREIKVELEEEEKIPDEKIVSIKEVNNSFDYQLINENRLKLNGLIVEIDNYLQLLEGRKQVPAINKMLAKVIPLVGVLIYALIEAFLIYQAVVSEEKAKICEKNNKNNDYELICAGEYNTQSDYIISAILFGVLGGLLGVGLGGSFLYFYLTQKPPNISSREKKELLNGVQEVLEKLEEAEKNDEASLFTSSLNIRALENILKTFNSKSYLPVGTIITGYTDIKRTLTTIRNDLNRSQNPISLFFQSRHRVIPINEASKPLNEKTPLLNANNNSMA